MTSVGLPVQKAEVVAVDGGAGVIQLLGSNKQFTFFAHQRCSVLDQGGYQILGPPLADNPMPRRRNKILVALKGNSVVGWGTRHQPSQV